MTNPISRRQFISQTATASAGALAFPNLLRGARQGSSLDKLNVGCIGIAHQGRHAVSDALSENLLGLCDVDWRLDEKVWRGNGPADTVVKNPGAKKFTDFRRMLDKIGKELDVVQIATPDHTHFPIAMAAMECGKHVFVEKPLAHNIWQVRTLQKAAHYYGVKTNMGNQGHTFEGARLVKEWYDNGVLGEVREVHCWADRADQFYFKPDSIPLPRQRVPRGLDWDLWQGPVEERPYNRNYMPTRWRKWWDYGTGILGDIGCHSMDTPFWALELGLPTAVDVMLDKPANNRLTPVGARVIYHFPARGKKPPVTLHWYEGGRKPPLLDGMKELPAEGVYMVGSKETVFHQGIRPDSPQLWPRERMREYRDILKQRSLPRVQGGPRQELFREIKGEGPQAGSNFDYSGQLTQVILLGVLAVRLGHRIEWDSEAMEVTNVPGLDRYIKEPVRKGWRFGESLWT